MATAPLVGLAAPAATARAAGARSHAVAFVDLPQMAPQPVQASGIRRPPQLQRQARPSTPQLQQLARQQQVARQQHLQQLARQQQAARQHQLQQHVQQQRQAPDQQRSEKQEQEARQQGREHAAASSGGLSDEVFDKLASSCDLDPAWRPNVSLLYRLGLRAEDFKRLAESRPEVFQMGLSNMKRKLRFLRDVVGLNEAEMAKVLARFPRVLEYQSERTLRPRLDFLAECGVAQQDLPKVVVRAPMLLELSVADTLRPRSAFLLEEVALPQSSLGKLILRHPQVLTCSEGMMRQRVTFLRDDCGFSAAEIGRAVLAHPQVLHYKIESMQERMAYLRSIGMAPAPAASALARCPQLFSLNVAANLAPKWRYLVEHLGGDLAALTAYPGYFSLSLRNRIVPRHRFLQHVREDANVPFPLGHLKCSDKEFAAQVAGSTLEEYTAFRDHLLLEMEGGGGAGDAGTGAAGQGAGSSGSAEEATTAEVRD